MLYNAKIVWTARRRPMVALGALRHHPGTSILPSPTAGRFAPLRDWDALKRAYEAHVGDLGELAIANNIQLKTLKGYAHEKNWIRADTTASAPDDTAAAVAKLTDSKTLIRQIRGARGNLVLRLYQAVITKLEKMEMDMEASGPLSAADHERHTRALATVIKSVENIDDLNGAAAANAGTNRPGADKRRGTPETASNDEGKLRRELAARIRKLRQRLER